MLAIRNSFFFIFWLYFDSKMVVFVGRLDFLSVFCCFLVMKCC